MASNLETILQAKLLPGPSHHLTWSENPHWVSLDETREIEITTSYTLGRLLLIARNRDDPKTPIKEPFFGRVPFQVENHPYEFLYLTYQGTEYEGVELLHPEDTQGQLTVALTFKRSYLIQRALSNNKEISIPITYLQNWEILIFAPDVTQDPVSVPIMLMTTMGRSLMPVIPTFQELPPVSQATLQYALHKMDQTLHECFKFNGKLK